MSIWNSELPFFTFEELQCKCCGIMKLDLRFAAMLPALRLDWGAPMVPNSVCRCPAHNATVGGHPRSLHLTENHAHGTPGAMAMDVAWRGWVDSRKLAFARLAHSHGFRIGLHNGFCHIDGGRLIGLPAKPFLYGDWDAPFTVDEVH